MNNGLTNDITFTHKEKKFELYPLTPSQVIKDQVQMKQKREDEIILTECTPAVFLQSWPIKPSSGNLQCQCSTTYMTVANSFMRLRDYSDTLVPTNARECQLSISRTKQFAINQGVSPRVPFDHLSLCRFGREQAVSQVILVLGNPGFLKVSL